MHYRPTIFFVATLLVLLLLFAVLVVATAAESGKVVDETPAPDSRRAPLPVRCAPYYNDGTDRWKDCMGVGYK